MYHRAAPIVKNGDTNFHSQSLNEKLQLIDKLLQDSGPVLRNVPTPVRLKQSKSAVLHRTEGGKVTNAQAVRQASKDTGDAINSVRESGAAPATADLTYIDPISNEHSPPASAPQGKDSLAHVQLKDSVVHEIKLTPDSQ